MSNMQSKCALFKTPLGENDAAKEQKKPERARVTDSKQGSILFWTSLLINAFQVLQKLHLFAQYNLKSFFFSF